MKNQILSISGYINDDTIAQVNRYKLSADSYKSIPINLNSRGGMYKRAKAIKEILETWAKKQITVMTEGYCESSAIVILLSGEFRSAIAGTQFHIHPIVYPDSKLIIPEFTNEYYGIISKSLDHDLWKQYLNQDFGVDIAKEIGLIHEITKQVP